MDDESVVIREFDSLGAAEAVKAVLAAEGVEARIEVASMPALIPSRVRLVVGAAMAHRARWILEGSEFTDRELTYLATGELDPEEE